MENIWKKNIFLGSLWFLSWSLLWSLFFATIGTAGCGKLTFKEDHYLCKPGEPGTCPAGWVCRTSETSGTDRCFRSESVCGNNIREGDEVCDGDDLNRETCYSLELGEGTLGCRADCTGFDASGCTNEPNCGNNIKEEGEECDGSDLGGQTCESQGFDTGDLGCFSDCSGFDTSGCSADGSPIIWIDITGGTFDMGSNEGASQEEPVHSVTVPTFKMTKTEVTVAQYEECVAAGECTVPSTGDRCNWDVTNYEDHPVNHPVNCITWYQAREFCEWAGGRLPSEAEWEYAARSGGQDITSPWGDETATCDYAVMDDGG